MATEILTDEEEEELREEDLPQYVPPPHFSENYPLSEDLQELLIRSSGFAFFPRKDRDYTYPQGEEFIIEPEPKASISCCVDNKFHGSKTVLYFHGNGERVSVYLNKNKSYPGRIEMFEKCKLNMFWAEYRGYGLSTGTQTFNNVYGDADEVFRKLELPPEDVILFGRSIGSLPCIYLASRYPVFALVLDCPLAEPTSYIKKFPTFIDVTEETCERIENEVFKHQELIENTLTERLLIFTAKKDKICLNAGELIYEWFNKDLEVKETFKTSYGSKNENEEGSCTWIEFNEGGHNEIWSSNFENYEKEFTIFFGMQSSCTLL